MTDNWRPIETAPKDGTEFQAWVVNVEHDDVEFWDPRCKYNDDGNFVIYGRVDYDIDGWDHQSFLIPTHWIPQPLPPEK